MALRAPNRRQVITAHYPSASELYEAAGLILSKLPLHSATHSFLSVMRDKKHGGKATRSTGTHEQPYNLSICNLCCLNIAHIIISLTLLSISLSLSLSLFMSMQTDIHHHWKERKKSQMRPQLFLLKSVLKLISWSSD